MVISVTDLIKDIIKENNKNIQFINVTVNGVELDASLIQSVTAPKNNIQCWQIIFKDKTEIFATGAVSVVIKPIEI